jgi:signal transduction histidine kinase
VIASRRNFLATVSHELRTPLTPIRGYVDILLGGLGGELTSEQRHFLEIIRVNNKRMQALVDDLLMMGQLDAGRTELRLEQLELGEMIASSVAMFQAQIDQRQIVVSLDLPPSLPAVEADAQRLDQILANLISNAVKYTPAGGNVRIRARDSGAGRVEVAVSDNGIGMSPAELDRLFTPFYRAERVLRDQIGGTGLGLSITRSLVELHGGTIQVASEPDVGSTFSFTLAAFSANDKPQPTPGALMAYSR